MRTYVLPLVLLGAFATNAEAQKKKAPAAGKAAPACGAKILPLVAGNVWTYNPVAAPAPAPEAIARIAPPQPKQIIVTVTGVEKQGADTVVSIEEKHGFDMTKDPKTPKVVETVVKGTITCNDKGKFDISPELFWFAGEPGGVFGLTFDKFERKKETSLKLVKGTIGENEWIEEITAQFKRAPAKSSPNTKLVGGKLEIERKFTPQMPEKVLGKMGTYNAEKLAIISSGRVTFDSVLSPEGKPCTVTKMDPEKKTEVKEPSASCELPANWISTLWLAETVGVVQTLNSYAHMYQLVDAQLK